MKRKWEEEDGRGYQTPAEREAMASAQRTATELAAERERLTVQIDALKADVKELKKAFRSLKREYKKEMTGDEPKTKMPELTAEKESEEEMHVEDEESEDSDDA